MVCVRAGLRREDPPPWISDHGRLPLPLAVEHKAARSVLERIEAAYPLERWSHEGRLLDAVQVARVEAFAPKVLKLITPEACAEKDKEGYLPLHWALTQEAPEGVVLAIIDAHPQVCRHAESRRTKEFSPLGPRAAVSWPWVLAWGSLEPSRRGGENAQNTGKDGGKMGEIWSKTCEQGKERRDHLGRRRVPCTFAVDLIRGSFFIMKSGT